MLSTLPDAYRSPGELVKNADSDSPGLGGAHLGVCISKELPGAVDAAGPCQLIVQQSQMVNILCFQAAQFCCNQVIPAPAV